jgi:hypothetical protein
MKELRRLVAICILTLSLVALAYGGEVQGVPGAIPPPPPECSADCPSPEASNTTPPAQDSTVDIVTTAEMFTVWLATSIL